MIFGQGNSRGQTGAQPSENDKDDMLKGLSSRFDHAHVRLSGTDDIDEFEIEEISFAPLSFLTDQWQSMAQPA
jgi:hypothetical protein